MEEWQDPDSEYLNCIGVGDTYVKKQIARILSQNKLTDDYISSYYKNEIKRWNHYEQATPF
jgi:hypothetical protein